MYGRSEVEAPRRIVCLTTEHVDICCALGVGDRVVGVPGTVRPPPVDRDTPAVGGGITAFRLGKILDLKPDLVLAFSDLHVGVVADLVRAGVPALCSNQRSIDETLQTIVMVGGLLGVPDAARALALDITDEIRQVREFSSVWSHRPRIYFEEWFDPLITGIRWISELIDIAGGRDIFPEHREARRAEERIVDGLEVVRRDPDIILASWCGKPVDLAAIRRRPGWEGITAVKAERIHEIDGPDILAPGPSLIRGLRRIHEIIQEWVSAP